jgi:molecular chaperone GrpE
MKGKEQAAQKKEPKKHVSEKDKRVEELTDTCQRLQAEFENYKKQKDKEFEQYRQYAGHELLRKLLSVVDSFEHALNNRSSHKEFVRGVEMIYSQLTVILDSEGVRRIEAKGQKVDPYRHDVMLQAESEQDGVVLEELQAGYMLKDRVLRHAKVKVGKKDDKQADEKGSDTGAGKEV